MAIFSDIDFDLTAHPNTGDIVALKDEKAIKKAIHNLVNTAFYERLFHPEIGTYLGNLLFENQTPLLKANIENSIKQVILNYEPRVVIENVVAYFTPGNEVEVTVNYKIVGTLTPLSTNIILKRTR